MKKDTGYYSMMRPVTVLVVTLALACLTGACGREAPLADTFLLGSDYEFQYRDGFHEINRITEDENGNVYFIRNYYIYKYDAELKTTAPLCGKPNCLHDRETEEEKYYNCNAFNRYRFLESGIAYNEGKIYLVVENDDDIENFCCEVYELSLDGTEKERIYRWQSELADWIIHRGMLYYVQVIADEDGVDHYSLNCVSLSGGSRSEKEIYAVPEGVEVYHLGDMTAYGNYLYFSILGLRSFEGITDENVREHLLAKTYVCRLPSLEYTELSCPDLEEGCGLMNLCFLNDRLVFQVNQTGNGTVYEANLDGSGCRAVIEGLPDFRYVYSDGSRLYISDMIDLFHDLTLEKLEEGSQILVEVYDENYQRIDRFFDTANPAGSAGDFPFGLGERRFGLRYESDEDNAPVSLLAGDKSQIGEMNGKEFEMEVLAQIGEAPVDSREFWKIR